MATVTTAHVAKTPAVGAYDRVFYTTLALVMALTVVAGFGPTYYFGGSAQRTMSGRPMTPILHAHGILFSLWVLLFIVQTSLVAARRVDLHRRLGTSGVVLAAGMVIAGLRTAMTGARDGMAPPGIEPLAFFAVPFFDLVLFAGFVTAAVLRRRNKEAHKRLMLLAYISIVAAATARLPGVLSYGPFAFYGLAFVFMLAGTVYDQWSRGRIHPVYLWGGAALLISVPARLALSATPAWKSFAGWMAGVG